MTPAKANVLRRVQLSWTALFMDLAWNQRDRLPQTYFALIFAAQYRPYGHFIRFIPSFSSCHSFANLHVKQYLARPFEAGTLSFYFLYYSFNWTMSLARAACRSVLTAARTQCFTIPTNSQVQCLGWKRILRPFSSEPPRLAGMCNPILTSSPFAPSSTGAAPSTISYDAVSLYPLFNRLSDMGIWKVSISIDSNWSLAQALGLPSQ
jgi:hypothetical protein